jgi:hypothetical protein
MRGKLYWLLQFRSDSDPREEYMLVTNLVRDDWERLAKPGFKLTASAKIVDIPDGHIEYFAPDEAHPYWYHREDATT